MAFTIPNQSDAGTSSQSEVDAVDFGILVAAYNGTGVVAGGAVTAQGSPNMTVAVAAGTVLINGLHYAISAGNGTITTADASNPRFDLITINTSGAVVVTAGTAASNPVFPAIPADDAVLAAVQVPAGDTAIATAQITDKRVIVMSPGVPDDTMLWLGTTGDTAMMHSTGAISANDEVTNLIEGTSVHIGTAANSLIVSNLTNDGDIMFLVSDAGNSKGVLKIDGANGAAVVQRLYFYDLGGEYMESDGSTLTITGAVALTPTVGSTAWTAATHAHGADNTGGTLDAAAIAAGTLVVGRGGTGITSLGTGVATFMGTPSSANLRSALTDETGTGGAVFATSPTLTTPALGTPSALVATNATGTAANLTAGTVTANANLTGVVTSSGNATAIADKAIGIAKLADGTDGELITWNASGVIAAVAVGTSGHILTSGGTGVAPTFQAAAAAGVGLGLVIALS